MDCCTNFYEQPEVASWIGDSFHPGGVALTGRTIDALGLQPGARVLDVACGVGTSTRALVAEHGLRAVGVDLGLDNLQRARAAATGAGLDIRFEHADAHALPFDDGSFDAVLCECALSTFGDKPRALAEFARVTRSGGGLAISDMAIDGELPPELASLAGPWACLQDATSVPEAIGLLAAAGYTTDAPVDEREVLRTMAVELKRRLVVVGLGNLSGLLGKPVALGEVKEAIAQAQACVQRGVVTYYRVAARRTSDERPARPGKDLG